ncbi:spermine oxidase [Lepeophtheirus salmonis]|uniref:spermine oxidase n=1 Tax=Lepeophtheirus salmonis TaxID=72036 RepID=UPI001AE599FD|nr:spermine oxidase-like [Lepeophtheirus salmonis]
MTIKENHHSVVIIGAGAAGLFAARTLIKSGNFSPGEIVILEAQDYVGGRIKTINKNSIPLELGAQWIHGRGDNPLWKFVQEKGIHISEITNSDGNGIFVTHSGKMPPKKLCEETLEFLESLHNDINDLIDEEGNLSKGITFSLGYYWQYRFNEWLQQFIGIESEEEIAWRKKVYDWKILWEKCDASGYDLKRASIITRANYKVYEGGNASFGSGYDSVIQALIEELNGKVEIKLQTEVNKVTKNDAIKKTSIHTLDGSLYVCDTCIITVSLGVLKSNPDLFDHETIRWPPSVFRAIRRIRFGNICRIKLDFVHRFWDEETKGFMILRDSETMNGYDDDDEKDPLYHYIYGFDTILNHPNMLMGWISGEESRVLESISDSEIGDACVNLLKKLTSQMKLKVPIQLKEVIVTRWFTNKFTRGAYSHATNDCDRKNIKHADLLEPVYYPQGLPAVMLAGEATDDIHTGTVHGAMCSGIKQANKLLEMNAQILNLDHKVELETA